MRSKPEITLIKSELFRKGGLEKYTWQIARDFCSLGHPLTVLTSGVKEPPFSDPLMNVVSLPVSHSFSVLNVLHFDNACSDYLSRHPTPIVFSLDRNRFQTHIRAGNGVHAAYLKHRVEEEGVLKTLSFTLNPLHRAILSLEKKAFENPGLKTLYTNSEMVKQEVLRFYRTDPDKIRVVHNGVEWHRMQQAFDNWESQKEKALHKWNLDPEAYQFLFIGHNYRRKGLEKLLRALSLIKGERFQLCVVGKEKKISYFKHLASALGIADKVFFLGPQQESVPFYQLADSIAIPSLYDPFANVTVEALAMGVFAISSRNNGGHEVLTPGNGSVVESLDDTASFAQTLQAALSRRKIPASAFSIRQSVKHLDFSNQLRLITESAVKSIF